MDFAAEVKFFEYYDKVANAAICLSRLAILMMWSCWLKILRKKMSMMIMDVFGCDYVIRRAAANMELVHYVVIFGSVVPKPVVL